MITILFRSLCYFCSMFYYQSSKDAEYIKVLPEYIFFAKLFLDESDHVRFVNCKKIFLSFLKETASI